MSGINARKREEELEERVKNLENALMQFVSWDGDSKWLTDHSRDADVTCIIGDLLD